MDIQKVNPRAVQAMLRRGGFSFAGGASTSAEMRARAVRRMVRHVNPTVAGVEETIDQPLYDSFSIAANTAFTKQVLFQAPIGQSSKTLAQTNLVVGGQLQFPQALELHAISVWISNNTTLTDLVNIQTNCSFVLTVGTKPMLQVPVGFLPAGRGALVNAAANVGTVPSGSAPLFSTSNGMQDPRAVFSLANPFMINSGESFNVTINPESSFSTQANSTNPAGVGATIVVVLDGTLYRAVQ